VLGHVDLGRRAPSVDADREHRAQHAPHHLSEALLGEVTARVRLPQRVGERFALPDHAVDLQARLPDGGAALWTRVGVENLGATTARGCVGRLVSVRTGGEPRADVDPVQLRWAGVPRSMSFEPVDIRPGQREFLNFVFLEKGSACWSIDTFSADDFEPGFTTGLAADQPHVVSLALFADNAETVACQLPVTIGAAQVFEE
jgi:hypothetical protein